MPDDELLQRLRRFHLDDYPQYREQFQSLVDQGQHPTTLFIGCSDSRLVPYLLTGAGPGELFLVRNVGAFVPPYDGSHGHHGTAAAIEFAVLNLHVSRIVVCGHSHCGAIKALYGEVAPEAQNLQRWLDLGREAVLPVRLFAPETPAASPPQGGTSVLGRPGDGLRPEVLRRTEQRAVVLQLERLMDYPMVRRGVQEGRITLHGWHYVIEEGEVHVFDVHSGGFVAASKAQSSGTGPYPPYVEHDGQILVD
ncbi:MAG: carbonic anhydrase [Proteobacteria bacterium]|nr:carbonic anhydrase [Pseudomonadota bacterium]